MNLDNLPTFCRPKFTINEGLAVQARQLEEWRTKLNAECYLALFDQVKEENLTLDPTRNDGYDVWRGNDMDTFVINWERK